MDPNTFVNPPVEYRTVPFWLWNGTVEDGEIVRQVREMSEKGIGGFCISARPGLSIPHLSRGWFDRVKLALEEAKNHGLQVWLHGEYPYPGGLTGERVALGHPQYRAQYLGYSETTVQGGQQVDMALPPASVLRAIAVPLRRDRCLWEESEDIGGFIGTNLRPQVYRDPPSEPDGGSVGTFLAQEPVYRLYWKAPAGRWRVVVFMQKEFDSPDSPGASLDPFDRRAVECFLDVLHSTHGGLLEGDFGGVIPGILAAETFPRLDRLPWSRCLAEAFQDRNGYNLLDCLPALIADFGPSTARLRYDYFQTLSELLQDNYHEVFARWC